MEDFMDKPVEEMTTGEKIKRTKAINKAKREADLIAAEKAAEEALKASEPTQDEIDAELVRERESAQLAAAEKLASQTAMYKNTRRGAVFTTAGRLMQGDVVKLPTAEGDTTVDLVRV